VATAAGRRAADAELQEFRRISRSGWKRINRFCLPWFGLVNPEDDTVTSESLGLVAEGAARRLAGNLNVPSSTNKLRKLERSKS
jgi:hypothetical protein